MAYLTKEEIIERILRKEINERIIINPLLNPKQLGMNGVDLRLSCDLIIPQKIKINSIDALDQKKSLNKTLKRFAKRIKLNYGESITLHPGDFIIGNTFEYIFLPASILAFLHGRSTWGRLGLIVHATAGVVHPNYQGVLTFELTNLGPIPIQLYPLMRIAQLIFFEADTERDKIQESQYSKNIVCRMPRLEKDYDRDFLIKLDSKF